MRSVLAVLLLGIGECMIYPGSNSSSSLRMNAESCPPGTYALRGWNSKCCSLADTLECGRRAPGNWAFNGSCECSPIMCPSSSAVLEPMKSFSGVEQIICDAPPLACQKNKRCASPSMIREPHTCNCLQISSPCGGEEILLGNKGGPYQCVAFKRGDVSTQ